MTPEKKITLQIVKWLQAERAAGVPVWWLKTHGNAWQRAGEPDLLICYRGRFAAVEIKGPDGDTTPMQDHELARWKSAGAITGVVRSVTDLKNLLTHLN